MPYASPQTSPSASAPTSPRHAPFFSDHSSAKQPSPPSSHSHRPHHQRNSSISSNTWSSPAPGPMPTLPRRSSSSFRPNHSPSASSSMIGSPSGGMVLPRRMSRDKSPGLEPKPKASTDSLGLPHATSAPARDPSYTASDSPSASLSPSPSPPPNASTTSRASPTPLAPAVARRMSSNSNISLRRAGSPALRVDIPPPNTLQPSASPLIQNPRSSRSQPSTPSIYLGAPRPTSSMIRKKSGEVVRPALKHRISRSTPVSGEMQDEFTFSASSERRTSVDEANESEDRWEQSRSEPATPFNLVGEDDEEDDMAYGPQSAGGERKTLRFAGEDDDDGELERVVLFKSKHKVSAVSRVLEGEDVDKVGTDTETETEGPGARWLPSRSVWASPGYGTSSSSPLAENEKVSVHESESSRIPRIHGLNFGEQLGKKILVPEWDNVVLESMKIAEDASGGGALVLKGSVAVRNITFGKWVAIRFTWDNWQTTSEVSAFHQQHLPASTLNTSASSHSSAYAAQGWDRFGFSIKLDDVRRKIDERKLLLVVRYSIDGGQEWWDNNLGGNYRIVFKRVAIKPAGPPNASQNKASESAKPAPPRRSISSGGNAFLPLLEGIRPRAQPLPAPSSSGSTHRPLPARLPSAAHSRPVSEWSFPKSAASVQPVETQSSLPTPPPSHDHTPTTAPITLDHSPSPPKLHTTAPTSPPTSPDGISFRADINLNSRSPSNIVSPTPPARPTHARTSSWNSPFIGSGVPLKNPSHQSSLSSFAGFSSLPPLPASPLPAAKVSPALASSDSRSPPSPSTSPLPATPISLPNELGSPGIRTLPEIGPGSSRVLSSTAKDAPLDSNSYADFVAKYCFFQPSPQTSSSSASPTSIPLPASVPSSLASSPAPTSPLARSSGLPSMSSASVYSPRPSPSRNATSSPWSEDATTPTARSPNPTQPTRSYFALRS